LADGGAQKASFFLCHLFPLVYEVTTILMSYEYNTTTALLSIVSLGALVSIEYGLAQLSKDEDLCEYGLAQLSRVEDFCE
jgi:hypothetical protein